MKAWLLFPALAAGAVAALGCNPPPPATPGVSSEAFEGPGDTLTPAEETAFKKAADAIRSDVETCVVRGYNRGIHTGDLFARVRFRRDGRIVAVGFKSSNTEENVVAYLGCVRAAVASMDLQNGPWEADRSVVYRLRTTVSTTAD